MSIQYDALISGELIAHVLVMLGNSEDTPGGGWLVILCEAADH